MFWNLLNLKSWIYFKANIDFSASSLCLFCNWIELLSLLLLRLVSFLISTLAMLSRLASLSSCAILSFTAGRAGWSGFFATNLALGDLLLSTVSTLAACFSGEANLVAD